MNKYSRHLNCHSYRLFTLIMLITYSYQSYSCLWIITTPHHNQSIFTRIRHSLASTSPKTPASAASCWNLGIAGHRVHCERFGWLVAAAGQRSRQRFNRLSSYSTVQPARLIQVNKWNGMNVHCKVAEKPAGVVSLNVFWMVMTQTLCENLGWTIWNHQVNHNLKLTIVNDCFFSIFCCEIRKSLKLGEKISCHVWLPEGMYIYIYVIQCVSKYNSIYIYTCITVLFIY